jgi:hypothetical protein
MKKIMTVLGILSLSATMTFAALDELETSEITTLRSQGYSESTLRAVDTVKYKNQGPAGRYKRHFSTAPASKYQYIKLYFDPIQDDDNFGEHQINFANTWNSDETHYTTRKYENEPVDNL